MEKEMEEETATETGKEAKREAKREDETKANAVDDTDEEAKTAAKEGAAAAAGEQRPGCVGCGFARRRAKRATRAGSSTPSRAPMSGRGLSGCARGGLSARSGTAAPSPSTGTTADLVWGAGGLATIHLNGAGAVIVLQWAGTVATAAGRGGRKPRPSARGSLARGCASSSGRQRWRAGGAFWTWRGGKVRSPSSFCCSRPPGWRPP